ncbi:MAG: lipoyl synthase [Patescibacteria group bacterium]
MRTTKSHQSLVQFGGKKRLPPWFKIRPPKDDDEQKKFQLIKNQLRELGLKTVCEEAHCPNLSECWRGGTATFMLMGDTCTRGCRFCAIKTGNPKTLLDPAEPQKLADAIQKFGLDYAVITSVARDDLLDGGARHIAKCLEAVHEKSPQVLTEILIPDFRGNENSLKIVLDARPTVLAHNVETTERLTPHVRDGRANYRQSLRLLERSKEIAPKIFTKTSIMLGLGETEKELIQTFQDLRKNNVDILTLGQYLPPSSAHVPLDQYVAPETFAYLEKVAKDLGFLYIASGPLVRSSYRAGELFVKNLTQKS